MNLDDFTPHELRALSRRAIAKANEMEQAAEEARHARAGCKWAAGLTLNYCATCGREESDMKDCPHRQAD